MDESDRVTVSSDVEPTSATTVVRLDQHFEILNHLYSTRNAEAYRAHRRDSGEEMLLWILRYPLAVDLASQQQFQKRIERIIALDIKIPQVRQFGIDVSGKAFVAMEMLQGKSLVSASSFPSKAEGYFVDALRLLAKFHAANIVIGDISEHSFLIDEEGIVNLVSIVGCLDLKAAQTAMLPASATLNYISPEERSGGSNVPSSDLYAIGVLGYRLFTGRYPLGERVDSETDQDVAAIAPAPSVLRNDAPFWLDDVLGTCLQHAPEERYSDGVELLNVVEQSLKSGEAPGGPSRWSRRTVAVRPNVVGEMQTRAEVFDTPQVQSNMGKGSPSVNADYRGFGAPAVSDSGFKNSAKFFALIAFGMFIGILVGGMLFLSMDREKTPEPSTEHNLADFGKDAPPELRRSINELAAAGVPIEQRKDALDKISRSDDPTAYAVLISSAKGSSGPELKSAAQDLLVNRIRMNGLEQSSVVLQNWMKKAEEGGQDPANSPAYEHILRACDVSLPLDARRFALSKAYAKDSVLALRLAAALAYDDKDPDKFTPVLRQLLSAELKRSDLDDKSLGALLLSHRALGAVFHQDAAELIKGLTTTDLAWSLLLLAENDSPLLYDVAVEILERKVVPPFQAIFLEALVGSDRFSVPRPVKITLVRGTRGDLTKEDVAVLGRWWGPSSERVLLAICALAEDPDVAVEAFDTVAARSLSDEPARSLVGWVKSRLWERRKKVVKAVGVLSHSTIATPEQIDFAFDALMPYSSSGAIVNIIISSEKSQLISAVLGRLAGAIPSDELVPLLRHDNRVVRISAVKALKGRNELGVLQAIFRAYERESDPEIQELYRKIHWVTRDRNNPKPGGYGRE